MKRINISSGSPWEDVVGYSRAVRIGNTIEVAGTTAVDDDGNVVGENDLYAQTAFVLLKIEKVLVEAGAGLTDVVRTRAFVTDISNWEQFGKAHGEVFKNIKPAATLVEVKGKAAGFTLLNEVPTRGADNKLVCFLHPKNTNGVLVELCMEIKK